MEQNNLKKNAFKFIKNRIDFKVFLFSFIGFAVISLLLVIVFFAWYPNSILFSGLALGFLFSSIGYLFLILSGKLLFFSKNKFWYILMFFFRLVIYSIPIIIFSYHQNLFCLYTIIVGICLYPLTTFFINIGLKDKGDNQNGSTITCN